MSALLDIQTYDKGFRAGHRLGWLKGLLAGLGIGATIITLGQAILHR